MSILDLRGTDKRWVDASGPSPADLAYVAEAPGMNEVREGRPLVGPSGDVNWQIAARYGKVYRGGAYVTNWRKIPLTDFDKKNMTSDEKREWTELLEKELQSVRPKTVIALGHYAVEALLGPGHSLFWSNGIPIMRAAGDFVVIPVVHPAAGLHESEMLQRTVQGYQGSREYFDHLARQGGAYDPIPARVQGYWNPSPKTSTQRAFYTWGARPRIAIDTEGSKEKPYCLTYSSEPDEAFILYADDKQGLADFASYLQAVRPTLILHNSIWDAGVLRAMGIEIWEYEVIDTIVLAFVLQDLPRGLKDLTRILLGIQMEDYEDVVRPWRDKALEAWRGKAYQEAMKHCSLEQQFTPTGKPKLQKKQPVYKWIGPEMMLQVKKHVERNQLLSPQEEVWARNVLGVEKPGMDLSLVPPEIAMEYAGKDAGVTLGIEPKLQQRVKQQKLEQVAALDTAVLPLVEDMQNCGLHLSIERYWEVLGEITTRKLQVIEELREIVSDCDFFAGDVFNPASGDDVAAFCAWVWKKEQKLGIDKRTASGLRDSTEHNVLVQLQDQHPFIPKILEFRELDRYEGTYLLPLKDQIRQVGKDEWRAFFELRTTSVVSGRLSGRILTWPSHTELGLKVRSIFTAPPGMVLASWDLSQIELRILAAESKDKVMTQAFLDGLDLHTNLAAKVFGVPYDKVKKLEQRTPIKTCHYLMVYGGNGNTLWEELRAAGVTLFDRKACYKLIADTWRIYEGADRYMKACAQEAREKGFVSDFLGRRRFLPACRLVGDEWPIAGLRYEAERQAGNYKIQAPASELLKRAMDTVLQKVYPERKKQGWHFRLWLQIHDELMGELDADRFQEADALMQAAMRQDEWLLAPIPIGVEGKMGSHWGALK